MEDQVIADSINDVDVKEFSESVVDKNYNHVIDGKFNIDYSRIST